LAAAQPPIQDRIVESYMPARYKCVDILQFEKLPVDGDTIHLDTSNLELAMRYSEVVGWLEGYFTALNRYDNRAGGDITMGAKARELMIWINNYCKSNPGASLIEASYELSRALIDRHNGKPGNNNVQSR
jgi:hypothetical protein